MEGIPNRAPTTLLDWLTPAPCMLGMGITLIAAGAMLAMIGDGIWKKAHGAAKDPVFKWKIKQIPTTPHAKLGRSLFMSGIALAFGGISLVTSGYMR